MLFGSQTKRHPSFEVWPQHLLPTLPGAYWASERLVRTCHCTTGWGARPACVCLL